MCKLFIPRSHTIQLAHRSQQHLFFAQISRVQNFSQGFFVSSGDVTRVVPSVGGGAGSRFSCVVLQTERPARHPATHLLIFSDEDFYLRLILYSFQPESMHSFTAASSSPVFKSGRCHQRGRERESHSDHTSAPFSLARNDRYSDFRLKG